MVNALTCASATSLTSTMLIWMGISRGTFLLTKAFRNESDPRRCILLSGGPKTTLGWIVTIRGLPTLPSFECQSLTTLSAITLANPYGLPSSVASSAHVSVVSVSPFLHFIGLIAAVEEVWTNLSTVPAASIAATTF